VPRYPLIPARGTGTFWVFERAIAETPPDTHKGTSKFESVVNVICTGVLMGMEMDDYTKVNTLHDAR